MHGFFKLMEKTMSFLCLKKQEIRSLCIDSEDELASDTQLQIPIDFKLRMLVIADTHNCLDDEEITGLEADVCLLLGDLSAKDIQKIKYNITTMPIYGVLGNHDDWKLYDAYGIENIHNKVVDVKGVKIAGLQGSIKYKNTDYPLYTDEESSNIARSMNGADVLISHDSPKYFHGEINFAHSGLQGVTDYCVKNKIPLNLHGHHHCNKKGILENGTFSMCCFKVKMIDTGTLGTYLV